MGNSAKTVLVVGADVARNRVEGALFILGSGGEWLRVGRGNFQDFGVFKPGPEACLPAALIETIPYRISNSRPWLRSKKGRAVQ